MRFLKAFGERIAAIEPDRRTAEIQIRITLMNPVSAIGTAGIVRVALGRRGKEKYCLVRGLHNAAAPK